MSLKTQVDVAELLRRVRMVCCPDCLAKVDAVQVPLSQIITVAELIMQASK